MAKAAKKAKKAASKPRTRAPAKPSAKKKKAPWSPPPLAERRGVVTFETNELLVLVKAPVEATADAFAKHIGAKTWIKNANGKPVRTASTGYVLYQMTGHPYTTIFLYAHSPGSFKYPNEDLARALSKGLKTKAIYFGNSDTASATAFEVYENGKQLERFCCEADLEFTSTLRDESEAPEDGPDIYPFVDKVMREHDAFAPGFTSYVSRFGLEPGEKVTLDISARSMDLDVEYAGGVTEPVFARVDYVAL